MATLSLDSIAATSSREDLPRWRSHGLWAVVSVAIVAVGYAVALGVHSWKDPSALVVGQDFSIFAFLYIAAQAIERILEPVSLLLPSQEKDAGQAEQAKATAKASLAAGNATSAQENLQQAANSRALADDISLARGLLLWSFASILGFLASAFLGLYLLNSVVAHTAGDALSHPARWLDILVTGLAIGGGTKPLHDLISNIQANKEKAQQTG